MIAGEVRASWEAVITLELYGEPGPRGIEAVVDTGFNQYLTLPPAVVEQARLPLIRHTRVFAAGQSRLDVAVFRATIRWVDGLRTVSALCLVGPALIGLRMMDGCRLVVDGRIGGRVEVVALGSQNAT